MIDDLKMAKAVLNGLPPNYETLIIALDAYDSDGSMFLYDLVKSRLLQEKQRAEMRRRSATSSVLLPGAGGGPEYGGTIVQKQPYKCTNCGHDQHTTEFCRGKDVNGKRPEGPKRPRSSDGKKIEFANEIEGKDSEVDDFFC